MILSHFAGQRVSGEQMLRVCCMLFKKQKEPATPLAHPHLDPSTECATYTYVDLSQAEHTARPRSRPSATAVATARPRTNRGCELCVSGDNASKRVTSSLGSTCLWRTKKTCPFPSSEWNRGWTARSHGLPFHRDAYAVNSCNDGIRAANDATWDPMEFLAGDAAAFAVGGGGSQSRSSNCVGRGSRHW
jgi:hypothetical protein